jgi:hypothetical protein
MSVLRCAVHYSAVANWQYCTLYVCAFVYCVDIIGSVPFGASCHFGTRRLLSLCQVCICGSAQLRFAPSVKLIVLLIRYRRPGRNGILFSIDDGTGKKEQKKTPKRESSSEAAESDRDR